VSQAKDEKQSQRRKQKRWCRSQPRPFRLKTATSILFKIKINGYLQTGQRFPVPLLWRPERGRAGGPVHFREPELHLQLADPLPRRIRLRTSSLCLPLRYRNEECPVDPIRTTGQHGGGGPRALERHRKPTAQQRHTPSFAGAARPRRRVAPPPRA